MHFDHEVGWMEHCEDVIGNFVGALVNHSKTVASYLYCVDHDFLRAVVLPSLSFKACGVADFYFSEVDPDALL